MVLLASVPLLILVLVLRSAILQPAEVPRITNLWLMPPWDAVGYIWKALGEAVIAAIRDNGKSGEWLGLALAGGLFYAVPLSGIGLIFIILCDKVVGFPEFAQLQKDKTASAVLSFIARSLVFSVALTFLLLCGASLLAAVLSVCILIFVIFVLPIIK